MRVIGDRLFAGACEKGREVTYVYSRGYVTNAIIYIFINNVINIISKSTSITINK